MVGIERAAAALADFANGAVCDMSDEEPYSYISFPRPVVVVLLGTVVVVSFGSSLLLRAYVHVLEYYVRTYVHVYSYSE